MTEDNSRYRGDGGTTANETTEVSLHLAEDVTEKVGSDRAKMSSEESRRTDRWAGARAGALRTGACDAMGPGDHVRVRWRTPVSGAPSSPVVDGRAVYIGDGDGVRAMSVEDGGERWSHQVGAKVSTPAVTEESVFATSYSGILYALDAIDGSKGWTYHADGPIEAAPAVRDGEVVIADETGIVTTVVAGGTRKRSFRCGQRSITGLAASETTAFVSSLAGGVYARDVNHGRERWRFHPDRATYGAPAVGEDAVYVATVDDGGVYAIDKVSGTCRWSFALGEPMWSAPAVDDGVVVCSGGDGCVYALESDDGTSRWSTQIGVTISCAPVIADETVFVGTGDGAIVALDRDCGTVRWRFALDGVAIRGLAVENRSVYVVDDVAAYALSP